jgi:hypothetical protein
MFCICSILSLVEIDIQCILTSCQPARDRLRLRCVREIQMRDYQAYPAGRTNTYVVRLRTCTFVGSNNCNGLAPLKNEHPGRTAAGQIEDRIPRSIILASLGSVVFLFLSTGTFLEKRSTRRRKCFTWYCN